MPTRPNFYRVPRTLLPLLALLCVVPLTADEPTTATAAKLPVAWSVDKGLEAPESAYYDAKSGMLFLSQIGGGGGKAKDGDGWISMLKPTGEMVKNKWVTGLNAPKGVRSHNGTLYVSDIDRIVAIDIAAGKISKSIDIEGAIFLNDLATGKDGTVYVSDMAASKVYQYKQQDGKGVVSVFVEGPELEHPNGLLVDGDSLILGGWGAGFNPADFTTKTLGRLLRVNLKTKKLTPITPEPTGHLDGIESDGQGGYVVTDWVHGKLFHITKQGKTRVLQTFPKGAADHAYLADKGWIILPEMMEAKLSALKFRPAAK